MIWSAGILLLDHPTARLSEVDQAASRLAESWKAGLTALLEYLESLDEAYVQDANTAMDRALLDAAFLRSLTDDFCV